MEPATFQRVSDATGTQETLESRLRRSLDRLKAAKADGKGFFASLRASHAFRNPYLVDAMAEHGGFPPLGTNLPPDEGGLEGVPPEDDYLAMAREAEDEAKKERRRNRKTKVEFVARRRTDVGRRHDPNRGSMSKTEAEAAIKAAKEAAERASKRSKTR